MCHNYLNSGSHDRGNIATGGLLQEMILFSGNFFFQFDYQLGGVWHEMKEISKDLPILE